MRHLISTCRVSARNVPAFRPVNVPTIVRIGLAAMLFVATTPLYAQKGKSSKSAGAPAVKSGEKTAEKTAAKSPPASTVAPTPAAPSENDSYNVSVTSALSAAPGSAMIGELKKATNVEVIARDRGWTRVRVEGWVPDSILAPADTTYRAGLSAADMRANPDAARGMMVIWNVAFLALQTADPLRQGLADGEPYILARGPDAENALLYLVVPPSLMGTARALQPLEKITVRARVRDGRSEPVGIPILDIQTIRRIR